ncbi:MAG: hypothetical protein CMH56_12365 [Myxococcales bacterium]|nr:hypothetical protein [Myxococcales bacterium]|tara:strand:+ start:2739 stop:4871 length:2133 start_codon:yes stop_codon:yes gene_type:complete
MTLLAPQPFRPKSAQLLSGLMFCWVLLSSAACQEDGASVNCTANPEQCGIDVEAVPARLYVDPPFGLGFGCVLMGCDEAKILTLENRGGGQLAITSVRFKEGSSEDFSFALYNDEEDPADEALEHPTIEKPLKIKDSRTKALSVTYKPTDGIADEAVLIIDAHDASLPYQDSVLTTVEVPLRSRVLGSVAFVPSTDTINFGYVAPDETGQAILTLENTSENDAVLTLAALNLTDENDAFAFTFPENPHANPGDVIEVALSFTPSEYQDYEGQLTVATNDTAQPLIAVDLRGTAFSEPGIRITPSVGQGIDFGAVRFGETDVWELQLYNAGGAPLTVTPSISALGDTDPNVFHMGSTSGEALAEIAPLESTVLSVYATPAGGGAQEGVLQLETTDPNNPLITVTLAVFGNAPMAEYSIEDIDFGNVVMGWQSDVVEVTIGNTGTGDLTIFSYDFEIGSSPQIMLGSAPDLPVKISPDDDPISFAFFLNGQSLGPANATFLLQTDAIDYSTARLDLTGQVVSCIDGCPVANGTPSCEAGYCAIGSCAEGYHDTNVAFADGCECQEERNGDDIGGNCSDKRDLGNLGDDCSDHAHSVTVTGNLHDAEDTDLYYVKMEDAGSVICDTFGDSFRAKVELISAPPGLALCVNIRASGSGCGGYTDYYDPSYCGQNSYSSNGSWSSDDDKEVVAWVVWKPDATPICTNYQIKFRADD